MTRDVLEVACPARTCRALIGEPCRTSTGRERQEPHGLRWLNTLPGPLVRCPYGPCATCRWTAWIPETP